MTVVKVLKQECISADGESTMQEFNPQGSDVK